MINQLQLIHLDPERELKETVQSFEWKTCLRTIYFGHSLKSPTHIGVEAYQFLLEIVCGLHSPMIGETEILCQFKKFVEENSKAITPKIAHKIIKDSKYLRTKYLKSYGSQSYGAYTLKKSKGHDSIVLIGAGSLTSEILPIVKDFKGELIIKARNIKKAKESIKTKLDYKLEALEGPIKRSNALVVIAAPMSSESIETLIQSEFEGSSILDLRSARDGRSLELENIKSYKTLAEVFSEIEETQKVLKLTAVRMKKEIHELSEKWNKQALVRPFGWEDLCL